MCKTWQNLAKLGKFCTLLALRIKTKKSSKGPDKKDKVENSGRIPRNPGRDFLSDVHFFNLEFF